MIMNCGVLVLLSVTNNYIDRQFFTGKIIILLIDCFCRDDAINFKWKKRYKEKQVFDCLLTEHSSDAEKVYILQKKWHQKVKINWSK